MSQLANIISSPVIFDSYAVWHFERLRGDFSELRVQIKAVKSILRIVLIITHLEMIN